MKLLKTLIRIMYTSVVISVVGLFFAFYFAFSSDVRFFSIIERYKQSPINKKIRASYPNLGAIIIHFDRPSSENGLFVFQLNEFGKKNIQYKASYKLIDIYYLPTYPFGFPIIQNSESKLYTVSLSPSKLVINKVGVIYELVYPFDKTTLLKGEKTIQFVKGKFFQYWNGLLYSNNILFFLTPTILYFLFFLLHFTLKDHLKNSDLYRNVEELLRPSFLVLLIYIGYDILFVSNSNDYVVTIGCILWILLTITYRFSSQKSLFGALFFISLCPLLLISDMQFVAEKAAIWAYLYIIMGTIHMLIEIKGEKHPNKFKFLEKIHSLLQYIINIDEQLMLWYKKKTFKKQNPIQLKMSIKDYIFHILKKIKEYILFIFYVVILTTIIVSLVTTYTKLMSARDRKLKNPIIRTIEPTLVYPATKVVLFGNSFGSKIDERYRLMKDGIEVRPDYWEDHKIIFTIPLGWKTGLMNIWIERPVQWNGETIIEKTEPTSIRLLPVTGKFTENDDLYFEQIKTWKKETREINGYK